MIVRQGTSHNLQYKNKDGKRTDVKLYLKDDHDLIELPLHKYFWKVVHDVENNEAIAFVGINDPHWEVTQKGDKDRLFKDIKSICPKEKDNEFSCFSQEQVLYGAMHFLPAQANFAYLIY